MKHIALTLLLAIGFVSLGLAQSEKGEKAEESKTSLKFEQTTVDYGTIAQGSDPYRSFAFTNISDVPVAIKSAKGSCGCTVPSYPKEPIMPGQKSEVKVRYDTQRIGTFGKTVTLMTTNDEKIVLNIKGKVYKEEDKSVPTQEKAAF